jgi:hypothetical protein
MLLRFYDSKVLFEEPDSKFHLGYHASNHEGGLASIHVANLLLRANGIHAMLDKRIGGNRLRHLGSNVNKKVGALLDSLVADKFDTSAMQQGIQKLKVSMLGLGSKDPDLEARRQKTLVNTLCYHGVPRGLAARVVAGAMTRPHQASEPKPVLGLSQSELAKRTMYDLIVSACREAKKCSIATREDLESTVLSLVLGKAVMKGVSS